MSVLNKPFVRVYKDFSDECWPIEPKETNEWTKNKTPLYMHLEKDTHKHTDGQNKNSMLTSEHC